MNTQYNLFLKADRKDLPRPVLGLTREVADHLLSKQGDEYEVRSYESDPQLTSRFETTAHYADVVSLTETEAERGYLGAGRVYVAVVSGEILAIADANEEIFEEFQNDHPNCDLYSAKASCGQLMGWMQEAAPRPQGGGTTDPDLAFHAVISLENQEEVKQ